MIHLTPKKTGYLLAAGAISCVGVAALALGTHSWTARSQGAPAVAGLTATQWAQQQGIIISSPETPAGVTAQIAENNALQKFPGCTVLQTTLVQLEYPGSQVVPTGTYWAVAMTPSAAMESPPSAGPAGVPAQSQPLTHMVVFLNAQTGAYVVAHLWS